MIRMKVIVGIRQLCGLFGITRQAWYEHQWRNEAELIDEGCVLEVVRATRKAHRGLEKTSAKVLYRIVKAELIRNGVKMGRDKFFEVIRKYGLIVKRKKFRVRTTYSDVKLPLFVNLAQGMNVTEPEQLWVCDITYVRVGETFMYLSLITDAYSHRVMGYYLSETLKTEGCLAALQMALSNRMFPHRKLVHHSDRGFQYRCQEYLNLLRAHGVVSSMTQSGDPLENAVAERMNGILKVDMGLADVVYSSAQEARQAVDAIIRTYNEIKPHSSVDFLVPVEAHKQSGPLKNHWKRKEVLEKDQA
jgi:putative transposase